MAFGLFVFVDAGMSGPAGAETALLVLLPVSGFAAGLPALLIRRDTGASGVVPWAVLGVGLNGLVVSLLLFVLVL